MIPERWLRFQPLNPKTSNCKVLSWFASLWVSIFHHCICTTENYPFRGSVCSEHPLLLLLLVIMMMPMIMAVVVVLLLVAKLVNYKPGIKTLLFLQLCVSIQTISHNCLHISPPTCDGDLFVVNISFLQSGHRKALLTSALSFFV